MKFSASTVLVLAATHLFGDAVAFQPAARLHFNANTNARSSGSGSARFMAMDMPAAEAAVVSTASDSGSLPVIQSRGGAPGAVRYSDFLRLVKADRVEKVTFSADGTQLLGVDTDGTRLKIEALPNDPDLLTELTNHKVRVVPASLACPAGDKNVNVNSFVLSMMFICTSL
jgi:hypothetical protein